MDELLRRIPDVLLFVRFVELDGSRGQNPEPIAWLRRELGARGLLS